MTRDLDARLAEADRSLGVEQLIGLGCDLADDGRQLDAEYCFRKAVALGEDWVWFNVGNALAAQGRMIEAVTAYERAIAAGETDAWLNLGRVLGELGDLAGAMRAYRKAEQAGDENGALARAYALFEQGEREQAEAAALRAARAGNLEAVGAAACWAYNRTYDPTLEGDLRRGADHFPSARADLAQLLCDTICPTTTASPTARTRSACGRSRRKARMVSRRSDTSVSSPARALLPPLVWPPVAERPT